MRINERADAVVPTAADAKEAQEASRRLVALLKGKRKKPRVQLRLDELAGESIAIPPSAVRLIGGILAEMGKGNAVAVIPTQAELTTQQAADLLNVSRPFLVDQLEQGAIPFRRVGKHRRIRLHDVLTFKRTIDRNRLKALEELSAHDQELGLGY